MSLSRDIKLAIRRALLPSDLCAGLEKQRIAQGTMLAQLNRVKPAMPIRDCEFSIFAPFGEDGIIQKLITSVPIAHRTFFEFGVEDFAESKCRFLMANNNWRGFVIDAAERWTAAVRRHDWFWEYDLRAKCAFLTRDNVNAVL